MKSYVQRTPFLIIDTLAATSHQRKEQQAGDFLPLAEAEAGCIARDDMCHSFHNSI